MFMDTDMMFPVKRFNECKDAAGAVSPVFIIGFLVITGSNRQWSLLSSKSWYGFSSIQITGYMGVYGSL